VIITGGLSGLISHHPWWAAAALAVPVALAAWGAIGPHVLESRHEGHMFGGPGSTGGG